jgi:type VI secretion system secreted protein VgrG
VLATALLGSSVLLASASAAADGPVALGTATSFAILAGSGITNTGATTITGDVGTFPTTTRTGFGSVTLTGTDHGGDAVTQGAKDALVTAYDDAFGRTPATPVGVELGGLTLLPGVYTNGTFGLTGTLTLDAQGRDDAQFVFQAGSTLIAEANSRVVLLHGANPCQVVWQVGSSATFKTGTRFAGDVLAYTSITAQTAATFRGRLLARNGAVTLDTNTITNATCGSVVPEESSSPASPSSSASASAPSISRVVTPGTPATGVTVPHAVPGTPRLPETGLPTWFAIAGVAMLALGSVALAAGHRAAPR